VKEQLEVRKDMDVIEHNTIHHTNAQMKIKEQLEENTKNEIEKIAFKQKIFRYANMGKIT
jgi:hypothetical protein